MPSKTNFGDLTLYSAGGADAEETFLKFRTDIAGTDPDSNFNKIAEILSLHDNYIQSDRRIFDVEAMKISENYYEAVNSEITKYFPYMLVLLSVSHTNSGSSSININSFGSLPIKKFDVNGEFKNLNAGDLTQNKKYLLEFMGEYFIYLSECTSNEILEKLKTVDGAGSGLDADFLDGKESTDFASASQGLKAESAIQSIKGNGVLITPDANKCVDITPSKIGAASASHTHSNATTTNAGFMSSSDKSKLDSIAFGATKNTITYGTVAPSGGTSGDVYFRHS